MAGSCQEYFMQIESKNQFLFTPALDFGGNMYFIEFTAPTRLRYWRTLLDERHPGEGKGSLQVWEAAKQR